MLRLTRQMTTRACVWKSGSRRANIATFPRAADWAYEESRNLPVETRLAASSLQLPKTVERRAPRPSRSQMAGRGRPALHLFCRFNNHGRAIGQNLRDPLHHLGRVIAGADDRIASDFRRML